MSALFWLPEARTVKKKKQANDFGESQWRDHLTTYLRSSRWPRWDYSGEQM